MKYHIFYCLIWDNFKVIDPSLEKSSSAFVQSFSRCKPKKQLTVYISVLNRINLFRLTVTIRESPTPTIRAGSPEPGVLLLSDGHVIWSIWYGGIVFHGEKPLVTLKNWHFRLWLPVTSEKLHETIFTITFLKHIYLNSWRKLFGLKK